MATSYLLLYLVALTCICESTSKECLDVDTSEGRVTLQDGQMACAPLLPGETKAVDQGKRFVTCSHGYVFAKFCPARLRFHVALGICHWPQWGDCSITGLGQEEPSTTRNPIDSTTRRGTNDKSSTKTPSTTRNSIDSTTRRGTNDKSSTKTPSTTRNPIDSTTRQGTNAKTSTETLHTTTIPTKSTTHITKLPLTPATPTPRTTTTTIKTVPPQTTNVDFNSNPSTTAPSKNTEKVLTTTAKTDLTSDYSTTKSSQTSTNTADTTTGDTTTDPSQYDNPCKRETCQLPSCFCYGARPNIPLEDTPMFLMLTFDGPVTSDLYTNYFEALMVDNSDRLFNQNGCPFRSTLFLAGVGTNYNSVNALATAGHEIASGTLTNSLPEGYSNADYNNTVNEIDGLRKKVLQVTKSQPLHDSIVGFRAPNLRTAEDVQFKILKDYKFLYDASISNIEVYSARSPVWPYTMDYGVQQCPNPPCPSNNYPGLWEMPLNGWLGDDGQSCSYVDSCSVGANPFAVEEGDWYNLFKSNFETYFYPEKVPMHISIRSSTFTENQPLQQALVRWLTDALYNNNDVWLVTPTMVIDWIQRPLTNSRMVQQKWGC